MSEQHQLVFWNTPPTHEEKLAAVEGPDSPFRRFVGSERAVRRLQRICYNALGDRNHLCRELALAFLGPASTGKTTLAKLFAEVVKLPFAEVSPRAVTTASDLLALVRGVLSKANLELVEEKPQEYRLPPCVIFLDEAHALNRGLVQALLKATEYSDSTLVTEKNELVDTYAVCWMLATTDVGRLFDAFVTRFMAVELTYQNKVQVARIVKMANPDLPDEVCGMVAHYRSRVPRKALEFARDMRLAMGMYQGKTWEELAREVAADHGINEQGIHETHMKIIRALRDQGNVPQQRMTGVAGCKEEELSRDVMPWLLVETEDQPAYVTVSSRGYELTEAGQKIPL